MRQPRRAPSDSWCCSLCERAKTTIRRRVRRPGFSLRRTPLKIMSYRELTNSGEAFGQAREDDFVEARTLGCRGEHQRRNPGDVHHLRSEVQHERGVDFATVPGTGLHLTQGWQRGERENVDDPDSP